MSPYENHFTGPAPFSGAGPAFRTSVTGSAHSPSAIPAAGKKRYLRESRRYLFVFYYTSALPNPGSGREFDPLPVLTS